VAARGTRALARPDAASASSLREIVEFRERGLHGLHCVERTIVLHPVGGEAGRSELKRVHGLRKSGLPDVRRV